MRVKASERSLSFPGGSSRRRVIATVIVAFTAVMAGLALIDGVVLRMLQPQLLELTRIGDDHGRALMRVTQLRERLALVRRRISSTVTYTTPAFDPAEDFVALQGTMSSLASVCDADPEQTALQSVQAALERAREVAFEVERAVRRGQGPRARVALDQFTERAAEVSKAADDIARYNAEQVRDVSREVYRSVRFALVTTSVITVLVLVAALVLLRYAVRAVSAHAALLERNADEMAAFASRAAHELRSPLQSLTLSLNALRKAAGGSVSLDRAESSARRLGSTVQDILEFSKSGGVVDPTACAAVATVMRDVEQEFAATAAAVRTEISCDVDPGAEVAMPGGLLASVLSNLLSNAVKYGSRPEGGRVMIKSRADEGRVAISISDDGPGIPTEALPHIFEPFYRASTHSEGWGLGLATVKRIVEVHGGHISVSSEPGAGATFVIDLPRARAHRSARSDGATTPRLRNRSDVAPSTARGDTPARRGVDT